MPLYTTYLGFFKTRLGESLRNGSAKFGGKETEFLFVMRKRGNWAIEPPEMVLQLAKQGAITWEGYRDAYLNSLATQDSCMWMGKMATKAMDKNVVLVCYEKDSSRCHRRLLAEVMAHDYGCEYLGELTESMPMDTRSK